MGIKEVSLELLSSDIVSLFNDYRVFYGQDSNIQGCEAFLKDRLRHHESFIFVGYDSGKAVSFCQVYPSFSSIGMAKTWILNDLYVVPEVRRSGYGRAMMKFVHEQAIKHNIVGISLSTAENNTRAQKLYYLMGYKKDECFFHFDITLNV